MTTRAEGSNVRTGAVRSAVPQAGKAAAKTGDFKAELSRAQAPFPAASARAARANVAALSLMAQAQEARDAARQAGRAPAPRAPAYPAPRAAPGDGEFRARIALLESGREPGMGYRARNAASGALGRYQFMPVALRDVGWQDARGQWTAEAARQGVSSEADFLANPAAQEAVMGAYLRRKAEQLSTNGAMGAAGTTVAGTDGAAVRVTEAGLVAAAHRRGASSVARWLEHRTRTPGAPVPEAQRAAFASVERRLRDFADVSLAAPATGVASLGRGAPSI